MQWNLMAKANAKERRALERLTGDRYRAMVQSRAAARLSNPPQAQLERFRQQAQAQIYVSGGMA
jgi:hypothetical protein